MKKIIKIRNYNSIIHIGLSNDITNNKISYICVKGKICDEPNTWAIDSYNENKELLDSYLYESVDEFLNDLKILINNN